MSHAKQFTLYTHKGGPNGWKVAIVLAELGLTYESVYLDFNSAEHKGAAYTKYNPNGRIPTIIDHHNNDFVVWESDAILIYLVERYDKGNKISVSGADDKIIQLQWLFFQASGQGPYYGQGIWFKRFHAEKIPSAIERYQKETIRVLNVLESVLSKQEWLVGGKPTIADLSFIPWNKLAFDALLGDYEDFELRDFTAVAAWHEKLLARPAVASVYAIRDSL
ncbi:glutathione S-transferase C-terminal-like protein [Sparassis latifolia]|uniref:glutathione transferase n=1 Tax=Sparassis crispa TaxID=139825 RepID=A0A401GLZ5_9APHY|nr:Glutathione S-transferase 2 [Sparassis crispa]GBE83215.1 Glutathione S-transferase 2 [Sparassis crispa]